MTNQLTDAISQVELDRNRQPSSSVTRREPSPAAPVTHPPCEAIGPPQVEEETAWFYQYREPAAMHNRTAAASLPKRCVEPAMTRGRGVS